MQQHSIAKQFDLIKPLSPLPNLAGNGLLMGRMAGRDLAKNDCDIESFLFGIGSTNLVDPLPPVVPHINRIPTLDILRKTPMVLPPILSIEPGQRYLYLN